MTNPHPGARKSRRGSLDIYTAEYALKIGGGEKKGITAMEQKTAFHMKVSSESEGKSKKISSAKCKVVFVNPTHRLKMRLNLRWSFAEDATFQHTSTLDFSPNFHSHPPVSRTKACPEFGTLSCPRCLEWGHWEDSCWAIDHVCERWLLWKMKMLQWQWQKTFSVQVWLCWSHWGCSWCQGLQTGQQPTVKFHSSKIAFHPHYDVFFTLVHAEKSHCGHSWLGALPGLVLRSDL